MTTSEPLGFRAPLHTHRTAAGVVAGFVLGAGAAFLVCLLQLLLPTTEPWPLWVSLLILAGVPAAAGFAVGFAVRGVSAWVGFAVGLALGTGVWSAVNSAMQAGNGNVYAQGEFAKIAYLFLVTMGLVPGTIAFALGSWLKRRAGAGTTPPSLVCGNCTAAISPHWPGWCRACGVLYSEFPPAPYHPPTAPPGDLRVVGRP